jgi:hypothetical protein
MTRSEYSKKIDELVIENDNKDSLERKEAFQAQVSVGKLTQRLLFQIFVFIIVWKTVTNSVLLPISSLQRLFKNRMDSISETSAEIGFEKITLMNQIFDFSKHLFVKGILENFDDDKYDYASLYSPEWRNMFYSYYYDFTIVYSDFVWFLYSDAPDNENYFSDGSSSSDKDSSSDQDTLYTSSDAIYYIPILVSSDEVEWEHSETEAVFDCKQFCNIDIRFCFSQELDQVTNEDIAGNIQILSKQNFNATNFIYRVTFQKDNYNLNLVDLDTIQGFYVYERGETSFMEDPRDGNLNSRKNFIDNNDYIYLYDYSHSYNTSFSLGGFFFFVEGSRFQDMEQLRDFFFQYAMDMDVIPFLWLNWASF